MSNPYEIIEPTCISFSGGRTSAFMLYKILEAHHMTLPPEAIVCFANTGKEEEATLRFIDRCSKEWNVEIHWLEYRYDPIPANRWKRVTFETASRNGEPFFELIDQNGSPYLPNPVARICTAKLKIRVIDQYLKSLGFEHNENSDWVGIRADEMRRAAKIDRSRTPLVTDGVTKETVGNSANLFWDSANNRLGIGTSSPTYSLHVSSTSYGGTAGVFRARDVTVFGNLNHLTLNCQTLNFQCY